MSKTQLERGAAEIIVSLNDGILTVKHGECRTTLYKRPCKKGDWNKLWEELKKS